MLYAVTAEASVSEDVGRKPERAGRVPEANIRLSTPSAGAGGSEARRAGVVERATPKPAVSSIIETAVAAGEFVPSATTASGFD